MQKIRKIVRAVSDIKLVTNYYYCNDFLGPRLKKYGVLVAPSLEGHYEHFLTYHTIQKVVKELL